MSLKSGHRIEAVMGQEQEKQVKDFRGNSVGTIRLQPDGWFLTLPFVNYADFYYNYKFRESDVVVMTYPKCGTTWTQEIVWTLLHNPNLDHPDAKLPINVRSPQIDLAFLLKNTNLPPFVPGNVLFDILSETCGKKVNLKDDELCLKAPEFAKSPRVMKTHLPFGLFNPSITDTCKIVYVVREPKDVAVSYHHHSRVFKLHGFVGTLDSFVDHFVKDTLMYSPFWKHVGEAWRRRRHPNVHFCFYEDMKTEPTREMKRLQHFLGTKLSDVQIDNIVKYTSFDSMKERDNMLGDVMRGVENKEMTYVNSEVIKQDGSLYRKGIVGDWKNALTEEQVKKIDDWTHKNVIDFGPQFIYGK